jgi:hypothetical protein
MTDSEQKKLSPAPINDTDVVSDFIFEEIFDYCNYVEVGKEYVLGGIDGVPYMLTWSFGSNSFYLKSLSESVVKDLDAQRVLRDYIYSVNQNKHSDIIACPLTFRDEDDDEFVCGVAFYYSQEHE